MFCSDFIEEIGKEFKHNTGNKSMSIQSRKSLPSNETIISQSNFTPDLVDKHNKGKKKKRVKSTVSSSLVRKSDKSLKKYSSSTHSRRRSYSRSRRRRSDSISKSRKRTKNRYSRLKSKRRSF